MSGVKITGLTDEHGYWEAWVSCGHAHAWVHRKHGSWQLDDPRRHVLPHIAEALQVRVRREERRRDRC